MKSPASFIAGLAAGAILATVVGGGPIAVAAPQQPSTAAGSKHKSRIVLENERVRVREVIFPANVPKTGPHTHDLPHVGVILTAGYMLWTVQRVYFGPEKSEYKGFPEVDQREIVVLTPLTIMAILLGVLPYLMFFVFTQQTVDAMFKLFG